MTLPFLYLLCAAQRGVLAVFSHQLAVVAHLNDMLALDNGYNVRVFHGGEPVGDYYRCPALAQPRQATPECAAGHGVER